MAVNLDNLRLLLRLSMTPTAANRVLEQQGCGTLQEKLETLKKLGYVSDKDTPNKQYDEILERITS